MAKILDLDARLAKTPPRVIRLGGRDLTLAPRTFGAIEALEAADKAGGPGKALNIMRIIAPDADAASVRALDPDALQPIVRFWSGQDEDEAEAVAADPLPPG